MPVLSSWPMDWIETPTAYRFLSHFFLLVGVAVIISLLLRLAGGPVVDIAVRPRVGETQRL
ncbi:MAG: hypothetical protein R3C45_13780 [Phycisphaerales bacterium]